MAYLLRDGKTRKEQTRETHLDVGGTVEVCDRGGRLGGTGGGYGGGPSVTCTGQIIATFTWVPDGDGDAPPANVIVKETCTATSKGYSIGTTPTGACDNALGFGPVDQGPMPGIPSPPLASRWYCSSGTRYRVVAGEDPLLITCTPSASASSPIFASASVWYTCSVAPVDVVFDSATGLGPNWSKRYLIGLPAGAALDSGGLTVASTSWSIPLGRPFKEYAPSTASATLVALGVQTGTTVTWFFAKPASVPVTCTAHLAVPAGCEPAAGLDVVTTRTCSVVGPDCDAEMRIGQVDTFPMNGIDYWGLVGAVWPPDPPGDGAVWRAWVTTPQDWRDAYGVGLFSYCQRITANRFRWDENNVKYCVGVFPDLSCDQTFPYQNGKTPASTLDTGLVRGDAVDTPGSPFNLASQTAADDYRTDVMFRPGAGGVGRYVPLRRWSWSWWGSVWHDSDWHMGPHGATIDADSTYPPHPEWSSTFVNGGWVLCVNHPGH